MSDGDAPPGPGSGPGAGELCRRCHHDADKHRHLRPGNDCSLCGCTGFARVPLIVRTLRRLRRNGTR